MSVMDFPYQAKQQQLLLALMIGSFSTGLLKTFYVTFYILKCGQVNCLFNSYFQFCSDKRLRSFSSNKLVK